MTATLFYAEFMKLYDIDVDEENGVIWATDVNSEEQIVKLAQIEEIYSFMPNTLLKVLSYSISSFPDYESAYQGSKLYKTFVDAFIDICYDLETDEIKETLYNKLLEREEVIKK